MVPMENSSFVSLQEKDYLDILETIKYFNNCQNRNDLKEAFETRLVPLFEGQAGVLCWTDPDLSKSQMIESLGFTESEGKLFPEWIPYDPLSQKMLTCSRTTLANDVDVSREEQEQGVQQFFKDHPKYKRSDFSYFDRTKSAIISFNQPEFSIGIGIHRRIPNEKLFTMREIRMMELMIPHLQQIIKTVALTEELAQYKSFSAKALDDLPVPFAMIRVDARILFCNQAFDDLFHLQPGQILPSELCNIFQCELAQMSPPFDVKNPKMEMPFYNLPQGLFRLNFTRLDDSVGEHSCWMLRLKPANEPYSRLNFLLQKEGLTGREIEVCYLVKDGIANQEIADRLFISLNTVKNHLRSIHDKLDVNTRAQLVARLHQPD